MKLINYSDNDFTKMSPILIIHDLAYIKLYVILILFILVTIY